MVEYFGPRPTYSFYSSSNQTLSYRVFTLDETLKTVSIQYMQKSLLDLELQMTFLAAEVFVWNFSLVLVGHIDRHTALLIFYLCNLLLCFA